MKLKSLAIFLIVILCCSLVGCGGQNVPASSGSEQTGNTESAEVSNDAYTNENTGGEENPVVIQEPEQNLTYEEQEYVNSIAENASYIKEYLELFISAVEEKAVDNTVSWNRYNATKGQLASAIQQGYNLIPPPGYVDFQESYKQQLSLLSMPSSITAENISMSTDFNKEYQYYSQTAYPMWLTFCSDLGIQ